MDDLREGDRFYHRGFHEYGTYYGCDELSDPTMRTAHVRFDDGREAMAFRHLMARVCCNLHSQRCEPPSELCCPECTEADHPRHPHGAVCVLEETR